MFGCAKWEKNGRNVEIVVQNRVYKIEGIFYGGRKRHFAMWKVVCGIHLLKPERFLLMQQKRFDLISGQKARKQNGVRKTENFAKKSKKSKSAIILMGEKI